MNKANVLFTGLLLIAGATLSAQAARRQALDAPVAANDAEFHRASRDRKPANDTRDAGATASEPEASLPADVTLAGPSRQRARAASEPSDDDAVVISSPSLFGLPATESTGERSANASLITFPPQGSILGTTQTFTWGAAGAGSYWLWVGTCQDCTNIADWDMGTSRSATVNLPSTGGTIYVTLFTFSQGMWYWVDYQFRAPGASFTAPFINSPAEGSTLSTRQTFRWSAGSGIAEYWLWIGSCANCYDIFDGGTGRDTTATVSIPASGKPVYFTLWFYANGDWYYRDYQFRAPSATGTGQTVRLEVANRLGYAINLTVNGRVVGSVPAYETRSHEEAMSTLDFSWELIRPTLGGRSLGDTVSGHFDRINNPSGTIRFEINNRFRDGSGVFLPRITNRTGTALSLEVNGGLAAANRCNCNIPAYTDNVVAGYYRLFSNSNVRLFSRSDYTGSYTYWGTNNGTTPGANIPDLVQDASGRVDLTITTAPR